ncbi:2'-deoxycytidine 5'-triphosphate deaminase [Candidatus Woesearchaeota archaeon]|nr:2'-deoxycytidine 5'-triphosphate deaminase [Candidatus Woesearchaeota archaeon]
MTKEVQTELFDKPKTHGVLPRQDLIKAFECGMLSTAMPLAPKQVQPSSVDLRLGDYAIMVHSGFLPREDEDIEKTAQRYKIGEAELRDDSKTRLLLDHTYIIPLLESTNLQEGYEGYTNPKSSTGRADTLTCILTQGIPRFNTVLPGKRKLYVKLTPHSWNLMVKKGTPISQLRILYGPAQLDESEIIMQHQKEPLLLDHTGEPVSLNGRLKKGGVLMGVDLRQGTTVYRARRGNHLDYHLCEDKGYHYDERDKFVEPISVNGELRIESRAFYILATGEIAKFPIDMCGALDAYDDDSFEGRTHYAGWTDPKFQRALTLEARLHGSPFTIFNGQLIALQRFERMKAIPRKDNGEPMGYGDKDLSSSYANQTGPTLGKQLQPPNKKAA